MSVVVHVKAAWSRPWADWVFAVALPLALLLPFLGKAFHMDDPLFIWTARHILTSPLDFYGFDVNWYGLVQPMHEVNMNPPGVSYYLAMMGRLFGWSEPALHGAMLLPAVALSLGVCALARRLEAHPRVAVAALAGCPAYLVSATSVMTDIPMTACYVWAVVLWFDALKNGSAWRYAGAGILVSAAVFFKYFGITLIPLMLVYGLARRRGPRFWMLPLLIPIVTTALFEAWAYRLYGHGLFINSAAYATGSSGEGALSPLLRMLTGLAFLGGVCLPALTTIPWVRGKYGVTVAGIGFVVATLSILLAGRFAMFSLADTWTERFGYAVQAGAMLVGGAAVIDATVLACLRRRDSAALFIALWVAGTAIFAIYLNWTVNARTLLPLAPALAMVLGWHATHALRPRSWALSMGVAVILTFMVVLADASLADAGRRAARAFGQKMGHTDFYYQGHWGFQYYQNADRAHPIDFYHDTLPTGAMVVVPVNNTNVYPLHPSVARQIDTWQFGILPWITVHGVYEGAGFYSAAYGPLPYVFGSVAPDRYEIYSVTSQITPP